LSFAASRQSKCQNDYAQCPKTLHYSSFLDFATPTVVRYSVSFGRMAEQPYLSAGAQAFDFNLAGELLTAGTDVVRRVNQRRPAKPGSKYLR
jgi:hypothetical protein